MSEASLRQLSDVLAHHIPSPDPASSTIRCSHMPSGKAHGHFHGWPAWHTHICEAVEAAGLTVATHDPTHPHRNTHPDAPVTAAQRPSLVLGTRLEHRPSRFDAV